jgi:hypothetical protein
MRLSDARATDEPSFRCADALLSAQQAERTSATSPSVLAVTASSRSDHPFGGSRPGASLATVRGDADGVCPIVILLEIALLVALLAGFFLLDLYTRACERL